MQDSPKTIDQKCGVIALIGAPNSGKSTLVNTMCGAKVSIVSPKVQTTRVNIKAIIMAKAAQLVVIDTPGIFAAQKSREKILVKNAWQAVAEADIVALVVDVTRGVNAGLQDIIGTLKKREMQPILILNKIDKISPQKLLPLAQELNNLGIFSQIFMVSAKTASGVDDLTNYLAGLAPTRPFLFPEDQLTDAPMRFLAEEITREKLFLNLNQELPYSIDIVTESWKESKNATTIHQAILVTKSAHKSIILGKNGNFIKKIGQASRLELEGIIGHKVNLFIFVKVS